jgi:hypothetical protein
MRSIEKCYKEIKFFGVNRSFRIKNFFRMSWFPKTTRYCSRSSRQSRERIRKRPERIRPHIPTRHNSWFRQGKIDRRNHQPSKEHQNLPRSLYSFKFEDSWTSHFMRNDLILAIIKHQSLLINGNDNVMCSLS